MNYYEELGLSPSASAEEIRQAYKELVRLLHPDQQQDEALRRAAERQMKRLNQVVAVLSDPDERQRYDLSVAGGPVVRLTTARVLAARAAQAAARSWAWLATASVAVAGLAYYFAGQAGGTAVPSVTRTEVARPVAPRAEPLASTVMKRTVNSPARAPSPQGPAPVLEPPPELAAAPSALLPPLATLATLSATVSTPARLAPPTAPAPVESGLAGTWLCVPPRLPERQEAFYPPEYIELRLIEDAGVLYGRYRARYRVTDRVLWPEVSFEFEGRREQENFAWRGTEGARGEVRLKPVGPDRLEVTWWASELGERLGLASGTAVLVRQRE